jgi:RimJ/RimL family protein N-acetyltransferase
MKPIIIETERLLLRPFMLGDEAGVLEFASNTLTQQHTGDIVRTSMEEVKQLIQNVWLHDYDTYGYGRFAVIHKKDNKMIGFNGIKFLKDIDQTDLGYRFLPQYWGKGIATESSTAILKYAFTNFKLAEIIAHVMPENHNSVKVLEKLAFQKTAFKPYPGETEDMHWYSLTKETYERQ